MTTSELQSLIGRVRAELGESLHAPAAPLDGEAAFPVSAEPIASLIDHTILRADAAEDDVRRICREAREHSFASVCVNPCWVPLVAGELAGSPVKVCTVVGFPLGASTAGTKRFEAAQAVDTGAEEVDMVINIGALKSKDYGAVRQDVEAVTGASHAAGALVKVIIETALLSEEEKIAACLLAQAAGADYVKTSTGFSTAGAKVEDVALMRQVVGPRMGVKASGGVKTLADVRRMVAAGATRVGASASLAIVGAAGA